MQIHATNITGLGASQVVKSFLDACSEMGELNNVNVYLPSKGYLSDYSPKHGKVKRYNRVLINPISRFYECIFSTFIFKNEPTYVLGDIPLRGIKEQVVLVHQPNLIYPKVNAFSSSSLGFRVNRFLFSVNHRFAKKIIVQTGAMAKDLIRSYPKIKNKVVICPQPAPNWLTEQPFEENKRRLNNKIVLFYPSAYYPHKKHKFLISLKNHLKENKIELNNIEILLTLNDREFEQFQSIKFIKNLGRLTSVEMNKYYKEVNALLFLSSAESYGLPLIEAIKMNLPIITVDLPYSRWICEKQAYYFEPYVISSFLEALERLSGDLKSAKSPDYSRIVKKFPNSWNQVVEVFINSIKMKD